MIINAKISFSDKKCLQNHTYVFSRLSQQWANRINATFKLLTPPKMAFKCFYWSGSSGAAAGGGVGVEHTRLFMYKVIQI